MSKNKSTPIPERDSKNYNASVLLVDVSFPFLFIFCGVVRVAGAFAYVGGLRDRRWLRRARGTRSALVRPRNLPRRAKKFLSYILACIATSANVRDANDFVRAKNHGKEISAGRETTLLTCFVVLTD